MAIPSDPLLALVATGRQEYREHALASVAEHFRIHLLLNEEPTWQRPYLVGWDVVPDFAEAGLVAAGRRLADKERLSGVLCWDEARIWSATVLAEELGLPSAGLEAINRCRDKFEERENFDRHSVVQPAYGLAGDLETALDIAARIGYPVVLKPRSAAASLGVSVVQDASELSQRYAFAHEATIGGAPSHDRPVLVEQFVDGPEISVDSLVADGIGTPLAVARKVVGFAPYFEETGHVVSSVDPLLADQDFLDLLTRMHTALGLRWGWTHTEFRLTPNGPVLLEVNARLGGDLIPYLAQLATGLDFALLAANAACGDEGTGGTLQPTRKRLAANQFLYAERDNATVVSIGFDTAALPAQVQQAVPLAQPGDTLRLPPSGLFSGRAALITVVADEYENAQIALKSAQDAFRLVLEVTPDGN